MSGITNNTSALIAQLNLLKGKDLLEAIDKPEYANIKTCFDKVRRDDETSDTTLISEGINLQDKEVVQLRNNLKAAKDEAGKETSSLLERPHDVREAIQDLGASTTKNQELADIISSGYKEHITFHFLKQVSTREKIDLLLKQGANLGKLGKEFSDKLFEDINKIEFPELLVALVDIGYTSNLPEWHAAFILEHVKKTETILEISRDFESRKIDPLSSLTENIKCKEALDSYQRIIAKGYPITQIMIRKAFSLHNYRFLDFIFKKLTEKEYRRNMQLIIIELKKFEDPKIIELFSKSFKDWGSQCLPQLFLDALKEGRTAFIEGALKNGMEINSDHIESYMELAKKTHNLSLIKLICQHSSDKYNYPAVLDIQESNADNAKLLLSYALNSPLKEVYEVCGKFPFLSAHLSTVLTNVGLCVRLPIFYMEDFNLKDFNKGEGNDYISSTKNYAEKNGKFIKALLPSLSDRSTRHYFLEMIMNNRYNRIPAGTKGREHYRTFRAETREPHVHDTEIKGRYEWSLRHFAEVFFSSDKDPSLENYSVSVRPDQSIDFLYSPDESTEAEKLTHFLPSVSKWDHTPTVTINNLSMHLEDLHNAIVNYPLDLSNPENKKTFFEFVARGYWLFATLCESGRGTPHNAMMWLNFIYEHHHLPTPIPRQEDFFLDNTMLMMPIEAVIQRWETFFEPTIDAVLDRETLKTVLQKNPSLLKQCSDAAQRDKDLLNAIKPAV